MAEFKLFNKWETSGVKVEDPGLKEYINLKPMIIPKTAGQHTKIRFHKHKYHIVERLVNKLMVTGHRGKKHKISSGHNTGKSQKIYKAVFEVLKILEEKTKQNPIQVLIKAIENAAPREEITSIEYGGARYSQPVDVSPSRRVDFALRYLAQGAYNKSFNKKRKLKDALAEEILNAYTLNLNSDAISKKREVERQADASR